MKNLLLTLGHNSSAILIEDNRILWGYETERLSGTKSDSRFPAALLTTKMPFRPDMIYATHWAPSGQLSDMSEKHWSPSYCDGIPIRTLSVDRTHHDTHMTAACAYAGQDFTTRTGLYGLVVDGFGTLGEHLSVYEFVKGSPVLRRRVHGYETSLGLWYQYATAFMGMKMHEDEYKLLGYEVHCPMDIVPMLEGHADSTAIQWLDTMTKSVYGSKYDPVYSIGALASIKEKHFQHLTSVCEKFGVTDPSSYDGRAILSRYVQRVLERIVTRLMEDYAEAQHLLCSGGVFLNVKLNKVLADTVPGQICVYPLAGDQGNALGLYFMDHPDFMFPENLNWGIRALDFKGRVDGMTWADEDLAKALVIDILSRRGHVNIVRGAMEFGPRALCNTTTLALPTEESVARINQANDRNTVMPMAPVMTTEMYLQLFAGTGKVWRSEEHMIVAMRYRDRPTASLRGIAHCYTQLDKDPYYTGRPQVIDQRDPFMLDILRHFGHPLINTSFNYHGKPIAYDTEQVIQNHVLQHARDNSFETIVIRN